MVPDIENVSLFDQVRATMLVTVFVFLGIEGASVYSRFAQKREHIGVATIFGFIGVTCLMVLVTLLPFGVLERGDIAGMRQPSMAAVLESVVGPWGAIFISVGLLVSVLGAYLAWSLICAEVLCAAARTLTYPRFFAENQNKVPAAALWMTNIVVQLFVISTYWSTDAFTLMLSMTSVMTLIPFLLVALYGYFLVKRGETYEVSPEERRWTISSQLLRCLHRISRLCGRLEIHCSVRPPIAPRNDSYTSGPGANRAKSLQALRMDHIWRSCDACADRSARPNDWIHNNLNQSRECRMTDNKAFGVHSEVGQLHKVMVCSPGCAPASHTEQLR